MVRLLGNTPWFVPRAVTILFVAALLAVILDAFLIRYVIGSVEDNARVIQAAREQIDNLVAARDLMQDAETGQRGYLLSGRPEYLEPYESAMRRSASVLAGLDAVGPLPADQAAMLEQVRRLMQVKLGELRHTIDLYRDGDTAGALAIVNSDTGKAAMDQLRTLVDARQASVQASQDAARLTRARIFQWGLAANIVMAAVAALILLGFGVALLRHLLQRQAFEQSLQRSNIELERAVADRTEELATLSHHLLTVREEEKIALAREMHDGLGSSLTAARIDLVTARMPGAAQDRVREALDAALAALDTAIEQQRSALHGLHPRLLDTMGVRAALESYATDFSRRTGVAVGVQIGDGLEALDDARSIALFRIVQEALTNVSIHARARRVDIALARIGAQALLTVRDDGEGFDFGKGLPRRSLGFISMRERARQFRGDCVIGARGDGHAGTEVAASIRLDA
jgi:signal transduction histidine kinase